MYGYKINIKVSGKIEGATSETTIKFKFNFIDFVLHLLLKKEKKKASQRATFCLAFQPGVYSSP